MQSFDVLQRDLNIHRSYFLEASAGTGKTFSIENLVVRLLIEETCEKKPLNLNEILVVTFTRAATRELKMRILMHINKALDCLKNSAADAPDYLNALIEKGAEIVLRTKRYLEKALSDFDEAQIFTIHSFCFRMLNEYSIESQVGFNISSPEEEYPLATIQAVVQDFFLTELNAEKYSPQQLKIVLALFRNDSSLLEQKMVKEIAQDKESKNLANFSILFAQFKEGIKFLQNKWNIQSEDLNADLQELSRLYKGFYSQKGVIKEDFIEYFKQFSNLFTLKITEQDFDESIKNNFLDLFLEINKKARTPALGKLFYPGLIHDLLNDVLPILSEASSPRKILSRMIDDCRQLLSRRFYQDEKWTPDELLKVMLKSLKHEKFIEKIFHRYHAVIIDEFQDTDPMQWEIFSKCFFNKNSSKLCYLVGDPKQSIYAFRKADIYTYLNAQGLLGEQACASLDTNYRSQKSLVKALNHLFDAKTAPNWMSLPKWGKSLPVPKVKASSLKEEFLFNDQLGSIHFFIAEAQSTGAQWPSVYVEENILFPYIASEIQKLTDIHHWDSDAFCILVRDRYQAERIRVFLQACGISSMTKRSKSLIETEAYKNFIVLLQMFEHLSPQDMRLVLGCQLFNFNHEQVKAFTDPQAEQKLYLYFKGLKNCLIEKGAACFFQQLMGTKFEGQDLTLAQKILQTKEGIVFYRDCQKILEILVEEENKLGTFPATLCQSLKLLRLRDPDDEKLKLNSEVESGAVQILTTHMSKGLEYEVVFALGLASRNPEDTDVDHLEIDAEKMRQLYVAMTRAKKRLYVPIVVDNKQKEIPLGTASPMELFCARLGHPVIENGDLYKYIGKFNKIHEALNQLKEIASITYSLLSESPKINASQKESKPFSIQPPELLQLNYSPIYNSSYTSLAEIKEETLVKKVAGLNQLPLGAETGIILHKLLENVPLEIIKNAKDSSDLENYCTIFLSTTPLAEFVEQVACVLFRTFKTSIITPNDSFTLCDIDYDLAWKEMEFSFGNSANYISGFIDCVFEYNNKIYLLDWKSNFLDNYSHEAIHQEMISKDYYLQAKLYKEALKRYYSIYGRDFDHLFGGAIYVFLRGCALDQNLGMYHFYPQDFI